jgi:hypothetical protein
MAVNMASFSAALVSCQRVAVAETASATASSSGDHQGRKNLVNMALAG